MSINVDQAALAELKKAVTYPVFLIQCGFGNQEFSSTGPDITALGQSWVSGYADFNGMAGGQTANITIDNSDFGLTQSAQNGDCRGAIVNIWYCIIAPERYLGYPVYESGLYEPGIYTNESTIPLTVTGTIKLFSGEVIKASNIDSVEIMLTAQRQKIQTSRTPSFLMSAPTFNHLPASGTVVELGNETLVIE